jgi:hypothetical protein
MNSSDNKVRLKSIRFLRIKTGFFSIGSSIFLFKGDNEISSFDKVYNIFLNLF